MSLSYSSLSSNIYNYINNMGTKDNPDVLENQAYYPPDPDGYEWINSNFAVNYDSDSNNGTFSETSVVMVSDVDTLKFIPDIGSSCPSTNTMAEAIGDYWIGQVTFGSPKYDSIISVSNDASKIKSIISIYMCSMEFTSASNPPYEHLFSYIETQVKSIVWTVTEQNGDSTTTYTVSIS